VAKGDSNRAITDFTQAIQFDPSYVEAYNNRGLSHEVLGRRTEAIADFRKAQSIDPADPVSKQQLRVLGF
jgi:Flp pilus assembly protein TadD